MTLNEPFLCSTCGKVHEKLRDIGFDAPDVFYGSSQEERQCRFTLTSDTCIMNDAEGKFYFVRGVIQMPVQNSDDTFNWGVWSSLSEKSFARYQSLADADVEREPPYFGWLSNQIPFYPNTSNLKLSVKPQPNNMRPHFTVEPTDHLLAVEQRKGMSAERLIEIVDYFQHRPTGQR